MLIIAVFLMVIFRKHCAHHQEVEYAALRVSSPGLPCGLICVSFFYPTRTLQCETLLGNVFMLLKGLLKAFPAPKNLKKQNGNFILNSRSTALAAYMLEGPLRMES